LEPPIERLVQVGQLAAVSAPIAERREEQQDEQAERPLLGQEICVYADEEIEEGGYVSVGIEFALLDDLLALAFGSADGACLVLQPDPGSPLDLAHQDGQRPGFLGFVLGALNQRVQRAVLLLRLSQPKRHGFAGIEGIFDPVQSPLTWPRH
jgi:hypothetical protein